MFVVVAVVVAVIVVNVVDTRYIMQQDSKIHKTHTLRFRKVPAASGEKTRRSFFGFFFFFCYAFIMLVNMENHGVFFNLCHASKHATIVFTFLRL